jgi:hypothetical protein
MSANQHTHERGANLVEAAFVIPVLLLLLACVVDLGRAYFTYITIIDAAREGARYGAGHPKDAGGICTRALAEAQDQQPSFASLTCVYEPFNRTTGSPVKVTIAVVGDFHTFLGSLVGRPTFPMSYSMVFRIHCEADSCT